MTIHDAIELSAKKSGIKRCFFGDIKEMVTTLNSESQANIANQPALFMLDGFRMQYDGETCRATLNILITVHGTDTDRTEMRNKKNFDKVLPDLRAKFLSELAKLPCSLVVKTGNEWRRPKANQAFGQGAKVLNVALDGWELIIDYTTDFSDC